MKKLIFFVLVCGVMSACSEYVYFDLPKDKVPLLKNNDIVYFQDSASSKIDTFRVNVVNYRQITTEYGSFEHIDIYYNLLNKKTNVFLLRISTTWVYGNYGFVDNYSLYVLNNYTINGVTYPTVYKGYYENVDYNAETIPNLEYYNYKNGIIRYEYKDGRVYNLVSK